MATSLEVTRDSCRITGRTAARQFATEAFGYHHLIPANLVQVLHIVPSSVSTG